MSAKRPGNNAHAPPRPQQHNLPPQLQYPPRSMLLPGSQPKVGSTNRKPLNPGQLADPRRLFTDQIIRDCYSKYIMKDGHSVPEIKYNTHLAIREYSQFPQQQPPTDIPPSQIGSVKNRILTVCTKHLGRVLLQKGKYNDAKRVFQIGRVWDLDELQSITRVGPDAFILLLNKDYYWKLGEPVDRFMKFIHHLVAIYCKFTGRYPIMKNILLEELALPPIRDASLQQTLNVPKQRAAPKSGAGSGPPPPPPGVAQHYANMDFTANGKLPQKPMIVMDVDRPGLKLSNSVNEVDTRSSHQQSQVSLSLDQYESQNDSTSFIFSPDDAEPLKHMPTISEYAQATGRTLPLRNYKPEQRNVSEGSEIEQLKISEVKKDTQKDVIKVDVAKDPAPESEHNFQFQVPTEQADFGIEEGILSDEEALAPLRTSRVGKSETQSVVLNSNESAKVQPDSTIEHSIREIEDFMDSEFGKGPSISGGSAIEDSKSHMSLELNRDSVHAEPRADTPATDSESRLEMNFEKDAEVEEMLDEIGWHTTDTTDNFVKKLTKELNGIKHKNIHELRFLDFGKDTLANEVSVASKEVDNLVEVFKKMEVQFNMISPEINSIESNSKGLQVRAVNKKILYNDLSEILNKVRVSPRALDAITKYDSFLDVLTVQNLEENLLVLYEALGTIGSATDDDLSNMKALKQFQDTYSAASAVFVSHFTSFMLEEFKLTVDDLNQEIETLYPRNLLGHIKNYLAYSGITNYVRWVSEKELKILNDVLNSHLSQFLTSLLNLRLQSVAASNKSDRSSRLSQSFDMTSLRKSKQHRFGSTRLINKLAASSEERRGHNRTMSKTLEGLSAKPDEISDPKVILRMIHETNELIYVVQYFSGSFFHSTVTQEYSEYVKQNPFLDRIRDLEDPELDLINHKSNSNELLQSMTAIFGNYINKFIKELTPNELIIPQILLELFRLSHESDRKNQDFIHYSFLSKVIERYKTIWNKFISGQVDLLTKADIRAKAGILPVVRNLNQIFLMTETSLQDSRSRDDDDNGVEVTELIKESYWKLTKAATEMFKKEDPLLKANSHDERERAHRNVTILQNVYAVILELDELSSTNTAILRTEFSGVFKQIQREYFDYLLHRNLGKFIDFVNSHSLSESSKRKKDDKILIRSLASTHTAKDMQPKILELHHKLEKHIIISNNVEEQDLLRKLWTDLATDYVGVFQKFDSIVRSGDRDVDLYASPSEIRRMFENQQSRR